MTGLLAYGFMLWGVMFAFFRALYPWSVDSPAWFDMAVAVVLAVTTAITGKLYASGPEPHVSRRVLLAAWVWPLLCVGMDLIMLSVFPPRQTMLDYLRQRGVVYIIVPTVMTAIGLGRSARAS
jgi:hypothetical protein